MNKAGFKDLARQLANCHCQGGRQKVMNLSSGKQGGDGDRGTEALNWGPWRRSRTRFARILPPAHLTEGPLCPLFFTLHCNYFATAVKKGFPFALFTRPSSFIHRCTDSYFILWIAVCLSAVWPVGFTPGSCTFPIRLLIYYSLVERVPSSPHSFSVSPQSHSLLPKVLHFNTVPGTSMSLSSHRQTDRQTEWWEETNPSGTSLPNQHVKIFLVLSLCLTSLSPRKLALSVHDTVRISLYT